MIQRRIIVRKAMVWVFALLPILAQAQKAKSSRPNVIVIFTDDQGYQDVGCFGSPDISTPNLDNMAKDGIRFTDFYSASPVCSPSRAALMTGCYPTRVGVPVVLWPMSPDGLSPEEVTIAEMVKEQGYATACIGKWHLGDQAQFLPTNQGFDSYFGIPFSNDMSVNPEAKVSAEVLFREGKDLNKLRTEKPKKFDVPLFRDDEIIEYPVDQTQITKRYTEEARKFIVENKEKPFFLYLAHTMPHIPLMPSEEFKGKSRQGLYGDVIEEIDWSVGQVLEELRKQGLEENTLVIFTSDNGPWNLKNGHGGSAKPLRGFKFETYEGGMRVPMIAQWKGMISPQSTSAEIASTIDLLPTIAYLSGAELPDRTLDGKNIWPLLSGKSNSKTPHKEFLYYSNTTAEAIRVGDWKLRVREGIVELYDLKNDISESNNLAEEQPKRVQSLQKKLDKYDTALKSDQ